MTNRLKSRKNHRTDKRLPSVSVTIFPTISLIGYGNWGRTLGFALSEADIPLREIIQRRQISVPKPFGAWQTTLAEANLDVDVFWICTPDRAIGTTGNQLADALAQRPQRPKPPIVFHSSGALASTELAKLWTLGASVASVHPLMTFPRWRGNLSREAQSLAGVPFAIEGDANACRIARKLVREMGGEPFAIEAENKVLYHALGTFASPLLIAFLTAMVKVGVAAGFTPKQARRRMRPIVERTVTNFFHNGPEDSFSGPIARGDTATVLRHLDALRAHPQLQSLYRALSEIALEILPAKNQKQIRRTLAGNCIHPSK